MDSPLVVILMGSKADEGHCQKIAEAARGFGLEVALRIGSAHKTPEHVLALLHQVLDTHELTAEAAVTGGCREEDGLLVNVEGTRKLMRYLADRGCKKFVNASSIAAIGFQNPKFRPLQLPIPDEHPCLDRDGYGLSKYLMEEVTKYLSRQNDALDVINLRLSTVIPDENQSRVSGVRPLGQWSLGGITIMMLTDAVRAFTLAAEAPYQPGVRIMNTAGPKVWASAPTAQVIRNWYGDAVDVSFFEQPGNEYKGVYDVSLVKRELGFEAQLLPIF